MWILWPIGYLVVGFFAYGLTKEKGKDSGETAIVVFWIFYLALFLIVFIIWAGELFRAGLKRIASKVHVAKIE